MQIQRGVGTSSNGTASYGGSINFESKTGVEKEVSAQLGYGSFNTQRANVSFGSGIMDNKTAIYTGISAYQTDGYKYHSGGGGYSIFVSGGHYGKKNTIKFTGFTGNSVNKMAWFAVSEDSIKKDPRINNNPDGEDDDFTQSFAQMQYVHGFNKYSTITTTAYCNRLDGIWGMFVAQDTLMEFKLGSNFYGIMSNYHLEKNKVVLNIGVHGNSYDRMHSGSIDTTTFYTNTGYKVDYSSYAKIGYTLGKFNLFSDMQIRNVGFRYNGDSTMNPLNWIFFNPKGGVTYNYSKRVNYYFSVGQSHREPTRTDMFGGYDNLVSPVDIKSEQVIDYELGSNLKANKLSFQYNLYFMDFKNEITLLGALGSNGLPLMANVDKSFRSGLELDLNYKLTSNFTLTNSSNYSYCRIKGGGNEYQPLYTPNLIVNQGVEYTYKNFIVGVLVKYHSESFINSDNTLTTPEFLILNANVSYKYKKYTVSAQAINITNKRYYTSGYAIGTDKYFFVNAPLSVYVTLKAEL
jgi:iron complex outermembrane receptor protein